MSVALPPRDHIPRRSLQRREVELVFATLQADVSAILTYHLNLSGCQRRRKTYTHLRSLSGSRMPGLLLVVPDLFVELSMQATWQVGLQMTSQRPQPVPRPV